MKNYIFHLSNDGRKICDSRTSAPLLEKGLSARAATAKICDVEGEGMVSKTIAIDWFKHFNNGETSLADQPRSPSNRLSGIVVELNNWRKDG